MIAKCGSKFCTNAYIGKAKIRERFQFAFKLFGISNWETICPNALRSVFITKLANDPSINIEETMAAARHNSVAASVVYQERSLVSEGNRINCLLPSEKNPGEDEKVNVSEKHERTTIKEIKSDAPSLSQTVKTKSPPIEQVVSQVTPSFSTTTSSIFSPISRFSHSTPVKISSAPVKLPPKPSDYLDINRNPYSVLTQYEHDELQKDISRVMYNNDHAAKQTHHVASSAFPISQPHISMRRQRLMDMRKEVEQIHRQSYNEYHNYMKQRQLERKTMFDSYPYGSDSEMINEYVTQEEESDRARRQQPTSSYWKNNNSTNYTNHRSREYWNNKNSTTSSNHRAREYWSRRNAYHGSASY